MIAPYMLLFTVFTVIPVLMNIVLSTTYFNLFNFPEFIGIENYKQLFLKDDLFLTALSNTLVIAVIVGPVSYILCFLLAWMITDYNRGIRAILTTVFYAPSISGAVYLVWQLIFSSDSYGYINSMLMSTGIIDEPYFIRAEKKIKRIIREKKVDYYYNLLKKFRSY